MYQRRVCGCYPSSPSQCVEILLDARANLNKVNENGRTPLFLSCRYVKWVWSGVCMTYCNFLFFVKNVFVKSGENFIKRKCVL